MPDAPPVVYNVMVGFVIAPLPEYATSQVPAALPIAVAVNVATVPAYIIC